MSGHWCTNWRKREKTGERKMRAIKELLGGMTAGKGTAERKMGGKGTSGGNDSRERNSLVGA